MTDSMSPADIGPKNLPPVSEKPYKVIFEANRCIGTGKCAEVSDNWELRIQTGIAEPQSFVLSEDELESNIAAAENCPAKKGRGVIHVIDRRTNKEIAPDPDGDGSLSLDW